MTVLMLPTARRTAAPGGNATCPCGSQWFNIVRIDDRGREVNGSVVLDHKGGVTGYAGIPRCAECGRDAQP